MLVSHTNKFIFIKPKKVAGTSVQTHLAQFCKEGLIYSKPPNSHMPASKVKDMLGDEVWNNYTKITVVRNPWDKMVSLHYWRKRRKPLYEHLWRAIRGVSWHSPARKLSFMAYVQYLEENGKLNIDKSIMCIDDKWPDYQFIRFENLHEDMERICNRLNLAYDSGQLPQKKVGYRSGRSYREYYDENTRSLVARAYKEEIERFGYSF